MNDQLVTYIQGATLPVMGYQMLDDTDSPVDLTTASSVQYAADQLGADGPPLSTQVPATIVNAAQGLVTYEMVPLDTSIPGRFQVRFIATFPSGRELIAPTSHRLILEVLAA